jgi:galactokinase
MQKLNGKFNKLFGDGALPKRFFCPGRVNIIGEHIDYLGGLVMPAAISLGITALIRPAEGTRISLASTSFDGIFEFKLDNLPIEKQGRWTDYVLGVIHSVREEGIEIGGFELLLDSTLPKGSGLSSSAALEVLIYFTLHSIFGNVEPNRTQMALACQKVENDFIEVQCGIMDQFSVANGRMNHAMILDCETLDFKYVPLDLGHYSLVIINSNKPRELADSAYNQRRKECDAALEVIQNHRPIKQLVHATEPDLELISDPVLKKRMKHAFSEQLRVLASELVLQNGDIKAFGELLTASHNSLKDDFEVSCNELDFIVRFLTASEHCAGARMTGAGFGGCCIAVIQNEKIDELCNALCVAYLNKFGFAPNWYACQTADGVHSVT